MCFFEMGKAVLKGLQEGANESLQGILSGFNTITSALSKKKKQNFDDNDYEILD